MYIQIDAWTHTLLQKCKYLDTLLKQYVDIRSMESKNCYGSILGMCWNFQNWLGGWGQENGNWHIKTHFEGDFLLTMKSWSPFTHLVCHTVLEAALSLPQSLCLPHVQNLHCGSIATPQCLFYCRPHFPTAAYVTLLWAQCPRKSEYLWLPWAVLWWDQKGRLTCGTGSTAL